MENGKHYPPSTLHHCCGVLHRKREYSPSLDIFKKPEFVSFRKTLDAEMMRLKRSPEVPSVPKRAEPISSVEEELMWEKGVLGHHSPRSLWTPWFIWLDYTSLYDLATNTDK